MPFAFFDKLEDREGEEEEEYHIGSHSGLSRNPKDSKGPVTVLNRQKTKIFVFSAIIKGAVQASNCLPHWKVIAVD